MVPPEFNIRGNDLIERGYESNQKLGHALSYLENLWLESDFMISKEELLRFLD